jgi:cell division protein FtsQ
MKKSIFWLPLFLILLTTYAPKSNFILNSNFNIKKIIIENNSIIKTIEIREKLSFLYNENLFFLSTKKVKERLTTIDFIESFTLKKIYPNILKVSVIEKKPIAILQEKKKFFFISDKGQLINFLDEDIFDDLPMVFGSYSSFFALYKDLQNIKFPIKEIKSFYFFESGRWDLLLHNDKVIKLPIKNYLSSLKKFMKVKNNKNFSSYKSFDYRITNQLILN